MRSRLIIAVTVGPGRGEGREHRSARPGSPGGAGAFLRYVPFLYLRHSRDSGSPTARPSAEVAASENAGADLGGESGARAADSTCGPPQKQVKSEASLRLANRDRATRVRHRHEPAEEVADRTSGIWCMGFAAPGASPAPRCGSSSPGGCEKAVTSAAWLALSYLLGAIPTSYLVARVGKGIDLRERGSRNWARPTCIACWLEVRRSGGALRRRKGAIRSGWSARGFRRCRCFALLRSAGVTCFSCSSDSGRQGSRYCIRRGARARAVGIVAVLAVWAAVSGSRLRLARQRVSAALFPVAGISSTGLARAGTRGRDALATFIIWKHRATCGDWPRAPRIALGAVNRRAGAVTRVAVLAPGLGHHPGQPPCSQRRGSPPLAYEAEVWPHQRAARESAVSPRLRNRPEHRRRRGPREAVRGAGVIFGGAEPRGPCGARRVAAA